jgi:Tfp pilus assembly protein PilV
MATIRRSRGLTLVECLGTLVIFSIGIMGAVQCINAALLAQIKGDRIVLATAIAENEVEKLRNMPIRTPGGATVTVSDALLTDDDLAAEVKAYINRDIVSLLPGGHVTTTIADPPSNFDPTLQAAAAGMLDQVTVDVWWTGGTGVEHVTVNTIISNRPKHKG